MNLLTYKAITAAVSQGFAIDFFFPSLSRPLVLPLFDTQAFSHALTISMQQWGYRCTNYVRRRTPISQTNSKSTGHARMHTYFYQVRGWTLLAQSTLITWLQLSVLCYKRRDSHVNKQQKKNSNSSSNITPKEHFIFNLELWQLSVFSISNWERGTMMGSLPYYVHQANSIRCIT